MHICEVVLTILVGVFSRLAPFGVPLGLLFGQPEASPPERVLGAVGAGTSDQKRFALADSNTFFLFLSLLESNTNFDILNLVQVFFTATCLYCQGRLAARARLAVVLNDKADFPFAMDRNRRVGQFWHGGHWNGFYGRSGSNLKSFDI